MKKAHYHRRQMIKEMLVLQFKLMLDAFRDFVLSPVSFFCCLIDIFTGATANTSLLRKLMRIGAASDRWINVFGAHADEEDQNYRGVDRWIDDLETRLRKRDR